MIHKIGPVAIVTDATGAATVYAGAKVTGKVLSILYEPGDIDTNATLDISGEDTGLPVLKKETAGTADTWFHPRVLANKAADGAAFTDAAEPARVLSERIKIAVTAGGANTSGKITFFVEEEVFAG